jgi:hypothetical protein
MADWGKYNQLKIVTSFNDTIDGILITKRYDSIGVEALGSTDGKMMFESGI